MARSAIAIAESRVMRSRAGLREDVRRLGRALARPASLAGAAAAGALIGFAAARYRPNSLTTALAAVARHGLLGYVRQRTAKAEAAAENPSHA
jgi:hypothetical protein